MIIEDKEPLRGSRKTPKETEKEWSKKKVAREEKEESEVRKVTYSLLLGPIAFFSLFFLSFAFLSLVLFLVPCILV